MKLHKRARFFTQIEIPERRTFIDNLLAEGDKVILGALRRHGKTTLLINLALAGQLRSDFLGFAIPSPYRTLLILLENYDAETKGILSSMLPDEADPDIYILTKEAILSCRPIIDLNIHDEVARKEFLKVIQETMHDCRPEVVITDNLSILTGGEMNDPRRIHAALELADAIQIYGKVTYNTLPAVIFAAHLRKLINQEKKISLADPDMDPDRFYEQIAGSGLLINAFGSNWALEYDHAKDLTIFMGGRQRAEGVGSHHKRVITLDENYWFRPIDDLTTQLRAVLSSEVRRKAWDLLPITGRYTDLVDAIHPSCFNSLASTKAFIQALRQAQCLVTNAGGLITKDLQLANMKSELLNV